MNEARSLRSAQLILGLVATCLFAAVPRASAQPFTFTYVESNLTPVNYSSLALGDLDGDGDLDVVMSGNTQFSGPYLPQVLVSRGVEESFFEDRWTRSFETTTLGADLWMGTVSLLDFNGDDRLDLFVSGSTSSDLPFVPGAALYIGDGDGGFQEALPAIESLFGGAAAWADYDGDGDPDLLLTGTDAANEYHTILYVNNEGSLEAVATALPDVSYGDVQWADIDNDGDKDVLLVGTTTSGDFVSDIFRNDAGSFTALSTGLFNPVFASVDLGDYDADGDLDVAIGGGTLSENLFDGSIRIFQNNGGAFAPVAQFDGGFYGDVRWGDHDNDGDLDLMAIGGLGGVARSVARVYENRGEQGFAQQINLPGLAYSSARFGDYDADGDLDVVLSGLDPEGLPVTKLYRNDQLLVNVAPSPPSGLSSTVDGGTIMLHWQSGIDELTPDAGLSYSVRVGTSPGISDVKSSGSNGSTGRRLSPVRGNADVSDQLELRLAPGTYYWSVQSVDNAFLGSEFAVEQSFVITSQDVSTGVDDVDVATTQLMEPFPNPSQGDLSIPFQLRKGESGVLEIYSSLGRRINTFPLSRETTHQQVIWDGRDNGGGRVAAGIYFVRLQTQTVSRTRTVVVVR